MIVYGIDLGGPASGWKVREADAVGLATTWAEEIDPNEEPWDYIPSTEHLGVTVEQYGHYETPS